VGQSPGGYSGDGGPATQAQLFNPQDVAVGPDGSLYIADTFNNRVRRVDLQGIITTVAGNGSPNCVNGTVTPAACFGGDGGPATQAELFAPSGIAFGPDGSLYIADTNNYRIRRVDSHGIISTVAGNGSPGCATGGSSPACYGGDGGTATAAQLNDPQHVALGSDGTLYIADTYNNRVRRVATDGTITTMVGNGTQGQSGDGGPAIWATITTPGSVTVGPDGGLYLTSTQDGRVRRVGADGRSGTVAGWGARGDGSLAAAATLGSVAALTSGPDGSIYFVDEAVSTVRRIDPDGTITTFAGGGPSCANSSGDCGDGGPATQATLNLGYFSDLAVGPDGSLSIADGTRIRRVGPDGIINTVAGTGQQCDTSTQNPATYCGDGGPATAAQFYDATSLAFGPGGALYVVDSDRVRAIMPDGTIRTVAGGGTQSPTDGLPATQAQFYPNKLAVGPDGSIFIATGVLVLRVGPDDRLGIVAGGGSGSCFQATDQCGDGQPATQAELNDAVAVTLGADGSLYIVDQGLDRVRRVTPDGIITTVAGSGQECNSFAIGSVPPCGDGGPATAAQITFPSAVTLMPDGHLCIGGQDPRIRCVGPALPGLALDGSVIPSADGSELYAFDANGRHLRTLDALTNALRYQFGYDGAGRLVTVTDGDGNVTTIQRDASGNPVAIVAPGGQRTTLTADANGYLSGIADPAGDTTRLTSTADGLLTSLTDPNGNIHTFSYDGEGRLARDSDPAGGSTALAHIDATDGYTVTATTALGRVSTYSVQQLPSGVVHETTIDPSGARTVLDVGTDDSRTIIYPDGAREVQMLGPDPRFGTQAPIVTSDTLTTPAGLVNTVLATRTVVLANPDDPLTLQSMTDTTSTNGRTTITVYDAPTHTITSTSAAGRQSSETLDDRGWPIREVPAPAVAPLTISYDDHGRLSTVVQGAEAYTNTHNSLNQLTARTDATGHVTGFGYDAAGRMISETLPGGEVYRYTYDANGNPTAIIMPGGIVHSLTYTPIDLDATYTPPGNGSYARAYNVDRQLTSLTLPVGRVVHLGYDGGGRPTGLDYAEATVAFGYSDASDRVTGVTRTPTAGAAQSITYTYDGTLMTGMTWSGAALGSYRYTYDNNFFVTAITLQSGADDITTTMSWDPDGLLTGIGPFTIDRNGPGGAPSGIRDGSLSRSLTYDALARLSSYTDTVSGQQPYSERIVYDNRGRIAQKMETEVGTTHTYAYTYDPDGQLTVVTRDGVPVERYAYDSHGNRTSLQIGSGQPVAATYDAQDRLQQQGNTTYSFNADGYLARRGSDTFAYSARGELISATVAGQTIAYSYDGLARLVGRTDSAGTAQYLYGNPDNPFQVTAIRDSAGQLTTLYYDDTGLLFALQRGSARYYVATDSIGTPQVVSDATGHAVKVLQYDSFGNVLSDSNPSFVLPIGFCGGLQDAVTGLVRLGLRDYDPETARWMGRDPLLFDAGQANLYAYSGNDPINRRDTNGLDPDSLYTPGHDEVTGPVLRSTQAAEEQARTQALLRAVDTEWRKLLLLKKKLRDFVDSHDPCPNDPQYLQLQKQLNRQWKDYHRAVDLAPLDAGPNVDPTVFPSYATGTKA
jgi:RHS repeat-associated protein